MKENAICQPQLRFLACMLVLSGVQLLAVGPARAWADDAESPPAASVVDDSKTVAENPAGAIETDDSIDAAAIRQCIKRLDDDRYAVREAAQKQLVLAGAPALEAVSRVAATGSLESSTRAVSVLLTWADSKDATLSLASLERLAALESRPTEAAMAFERLAEVRQAAAVAAIKELGGRFEFDRSFGMIVGPHSPVQVIIGPQWKGGVEGLRHIAAIRTATTVSLHSAPLDDAAVDELVNLTQVRRMEVFGTGLTPEGVAKLQEKLPQLMIDVRSGARLGIRGLVIEQVVEGSPAEKAGLQRQDRITEFAGKPIENFEQLTQEIAKCKPGDTVSLKALRQNPATGQAETVELSATFDRWGDDPRPLNGLPGQADPFAPIQQIQPGVQRTIIIQGGRFQGGGIQAPPNLDRR